MRFLIIASFEERQKMMRLGEALQTLGHAVRAYSEATRQTLVAHEEYGSFNPSTQPYENWLECHPSYKEALREVSANLAKLAEAEAIILLLPGNQDTGTACGLALGLGKKVFVVGCPKEGGLSLVHLMGSAKTVPKRFQDLDCFLTWFKKQ